MITFHEFLNIFEWFVCFQFFAFAPYRLRWCHSSWRHSPLHCAAPYAVTALHAAGHTSHRCRNHTSVAHTISLIKLLAGNSDWVTKSNKVAPCEATRANGTWCHWEFASALTGKVQLCTLENYSFMHCKKHSILPQKCDVRPSRGVALQATGSVAGRVLRRAKKAWTLRLSREW